MWDDRATFYRTPESEGDPAGSPGDLFDALPDRNAEDEGREPFLNLPDATVTDSLSSRDRDELGAVDYEAVLKVYLPDYVPMDLIEYGDEVVTEIGTGRVARKRHAGNLVYVRSTTED